jgi:hypothetical protein
MTDCSRRGFLRGLVALVSAPRLLSFVDPLNEISHVAPAYTVMATGTGGLIRGAPLSTLADFSAALKRTYCDGYFAKMEEHTSAVAARMFGLPYTPKPLFTSCSVHGVHDWAAEAALDAAQEREEDEYRSTVIGAAHQEALDEGWDRRFPDDVEEEEEYDDD